MKPYELIDHTADIGLRITGSSYKNLFMNAAIGTREMLLRKLPDSYEWTRDISLVAATPEELLVEWLSNILYHYEVQDFMFSTCCIDSVNERSLKARWQGGKIDKSHHELLRYDIKAVTFHELSIKKMKQGFTCAVYFDV